MTVTSVQPHLLLAAEVRSVERLGPSFVRIRFGGEGFDQLGPEGPTYDQRIKLLFPTAGQRLPLHRLSAASWYADWQALPDEDRGHVRTYTARSVQGEGAGRQLLVDFVLHEPSGPAARFAASADAGDVIGLLAPRRGLEDPFGGIEFRPGAARRLCLVADETAVPALASILEALPPGTRGWAVAEVPDAGDVQHISTAADLEVEWIVRGSRPRGSATIEAVRRHWRSDPTVPLEQPVPPTSGAPEAPAAPAAPRTPSPTSPTSPTSGRRVSSAPRARRYPAARPRPRPRAATRPMRGTLGTRTRSRRFDASSSERSASHVTTSRSWGTGRSAPPTCSGAGSEPSGIRHNGWRPFRRREKPHGDLARTGLPARGDL